MNEKLKVYLFCIYVEGMMPSFKEIGLSYIAAYLKDKGCEVILRFPREGEIDYDEIKTFHPDLIGMSAYDVSGKATLEVSQKLSVLFPKIPICLGGYFPTFSYRKIMSEAPWISYIIRGEGEEAVYELLLSVQKKRNRADIGGLVYRDRDRIIVNAERKNISDLDELPFPDRSCIQEDHVVQVLTSRGCTSNCAFCSSKRFWKNWRGRSAENIADELEYIVNKYHKHNFLIQDSSFEDPDRQCNRLRHIAEEIIRRNLNISYYANFRAEFHTKAYPELMELLKKSGLCGALIGVETGNQADMKLYRKKAALQDNRDIITYLSQYGLHVDLGFINFNPYSTVESLKDNIDFLEAFGKASNPYFISSRYAAFNCSDIYGQIERDGLFFGETAGAYDYRFTDARVGALYECIERCFAEINQKTNNGFEQLQYHTFGFPFRLTCVQREVNRENAHTSLDKAIQNTQKNNKDICMQVNQYIAKWFNALLEAACDGNSQEQLQTVSQRLLDSNILNRYIRQLYAERILLAKTLEAMHLGNMISCLM